MWVSGVSLCRSFLYSKRAFYVSRAVLPVGLGAAGTKDTSTAYAAQPRARLQELIHSSQQVPGVAVGMQLL